MDKFPLICTLAVVFVFLAGACGIAGVQNMKLKDDALYSSSKSVSVKSHSSYMPKGFAGSVYEETAQARLEKLLSPQKFDKSDSIIDEASIEGVNVESLRSIKGGVNGSERRLSMERKAIEVRGELLVSF